MPTIPAMTRMMLPNTTNARNPSRIDAPIASVPTTMTSALAIGLPAGRPLFADGYLKALPLVLHQSDDRGE